MAVPDDLTTLGRLKRWLGIPENNTESDVLLQQLITRGSRFVLTYLNRGTLAVTTYNDVYDGHGNSFMMLRESPVQSVASVGFTGVSVPASAPGNPMGSGYIFDPPTPGGEQQRLTLLGGYRFPNGRSLIQVTYNAGFQITQSDVIPGTPFKIEVDYVWLNDQGVTINGVALTKVASTPATGQYAVVDGVYEFNTAQAGQTAVITYSYVPADIEQAVIEIISERFKYKDRIGYRSKTLGGQETVTFDNRALTDTVKSYLQSYKVVIPV